MSNNLEESAFPKLKDLVKNLMYRLEEVQTLRVRQTSFLIKIRRKIIRRVIRIIKEVKEEIITISNSQSEEGTMITIETIIIHKKGSIKDQTEVITCTKVVTEAGQIDMEEEEEMNSILLRKIRIRSISINTTINIIIRNIIIKREGILIQVTKIGIGNSLAMMMIKERNNIKEMYLPLSLLHCLLKIRKIQVLTNNKMEMTSRRISILDLE